MPMPSDPPQAAIRIASVTAAGRCGLGWRRSRRGGDLVFARGPLRNHQDRDVGAGDEQRQKYGGAEDVGQHERHLLAHGRPFESRGPQCELPLPCRELLRIFGERWLEALLESTARQWVAPDSVIARSPGSGLRSLTWRRNCSRRC